MTENCQKINVSAGIIMNILPSTDLGWKQIFLSVCETSAVFWNSFLFTFLPQNAHINITGSLLRILTISKHIKKNLKSVKLRIQVLQ